MHLRKSLRSLCPPKNIGHRGAGGPNLGIISQMMPWERVHCGHWSGRTWMFGILATSKSLHYLFGISLLTSLYLLRWLKDSCFSQQSRPQLRYMAPTKSLQSNFALVSAAQVSQCLPGFRDRYWLLSTVDHRIEIGEDGAILPEVNLPRHGRGLLQEDLPSARIQTSRHPIWHTPIVAPTVPRTGRDQPQDSA